MYKSIQVFLIMGKAGGIDYFLRTINFKGQTHMSCLHIIMADINTYWYSQYFTVHSYLASSKNALKFGHVLSCALLDLIYSILTEGLLMPLVKM